MEILFDVPLTREVQSGGMPADAAAFTAASSGHDDYGAAMQFGVLGPVEASEKRRRLSLGGPKQRTVLALLISRAGSAVSTDFLVDGVYGDESTQGARRSIQTYVSNLRRELGEIIEATGSGYILNAARSDVDSLLFEDALSKASGLDDPERASQALRDALALWRGHPYADVDGFDELAAERTRLGELRMSAIEHRVDADLTLGQHRQLIAELESLTEEHPLRERFRAQHMLALYRCGRQAEALRAYEKTRNYLVDEMGLDPSPDLRDLEQRILDQDPALGFDSGPTVKQASILVADVADPRLLSELSPADRDTVITHQADALWAGAADNDGGLFAHRGSAIYALFDDVEGAVSAAATIQQSLAETGEPMRMAIGVGEVQVSQDETVEGPPVTRAAQLIAAAHGGQVLLSTEANHALSESGGAGWVVRSLGQHDVDNSGQARPVYQIIVDGLTSDFPPLRTEMLPLPLPITTRGLPGYELREEVGSGAFGVVRRAYQPSVGREVAIKIIRPEYANDPQFIRRFEVEAQLVARLEHPHIVPLHDYWRNPDGAFLVLRWLGGGTLRDRLAGGSLTVSEAQALLADIGPALAFAHRRGVVHRDIKPSNVLLDDEGGAYLSDFGIASDVARNGAGSVDQDVQALAALLEQCLGDSIDDAVSGVLERTTSGDGFADVDSFMVAWGEAMGTEDASARVVGFTPTRNPYKGLTAFGEHDAGDFHGRDAEIEEIVNTLADHSLIAVIGPSGIGKSSVVRAGMIPALRSGAIPGSDGWLITGMLPGAYPYEELASALMRVAVEMPADLEEDLRRDARGLVRSVKRYVPEGETVLLVVDQFEELFTLGQGEERDAFLAMVAETIGDERSNVRIVITMRADFFDRPLRFAALGDALRAGTIPIAAPSDEGLHAIVTEPAESVGVAFEPGLVERIISDVKHQPGALPLLEFSLTELFAQRNTDLLTLAAYETSGGVLGALGRRAETTYADLDTEGQEAARETFLRLVNVTEAGRDTRRRVRLTELERLGFTGLVLSDMLDAFGHHRLLTFDRDPVTRGPTVEVAHEAILIEWPRFAGWIDEHREDLLLRSRLAVAVADWEAAERTDTYLLTGGRLDQHEDWTTGTELTLTTAEEEFLAASRTAEEERRTKRSRTRRLVMSGFGIAAIIALALAGAALFAQEDANDKATLAQSRALAAAAIGVLSEDPELSLLLSIESARTAELDFEGRKAIRASLAEHRTVASWTWDHSRLWMAWTDMSPDGTLVAVNGSHEDFEVWDVSGSEPRRLWHGRLPENYGSISHFTVDGTQLAVIGFWQGFNDSTLGPPPETNLARGVRFYDARTGELQRILDGTDSLCKSEMGPDQRFTDLLWIDPDGVWIESGECENVEGLHWWLVDAETGARTSDPQPIPTDLDAVFVTPNGWLVEWNQHSEIAQRNLLTGEVRDVIEASTDWPPISPKGNFVIGAETIIDAATGEHLWRFYPNEFKQDGWLPPCFVTKFNDSETTAFIGCNDGTARVHDARSGRLIATLRGHTGWVSAGSNAAGDLVSTGGADGAMRVWDLHTPRGISRISLQDGYYADASLHVVGDRATVLVYPKEKSTLFDGGVSVMTRVTPGVAIVFDTTDGQELARIENAGGKVVRLSPDGSRLAVQSVTESGVGLGSVKIHDLQSPLESTAMQGNCEWEPSGLFWTGDSEDCSFGGDIFAADVTDLHWSPNGRWLAATAGRAQRVIVWDAATGDVVFLTEQLGAYPFSSVQFNPDGSMLSASGKAGTWTFDTSDWSEVAMVTHPGRPSWAMRYTPDGSQLITAQAHRGQLRIFDTGTWEQRDISTGRGQSRDMTISSDGRIVALATNIGLIHIVDIETGTILETYPLPDTDVTNVEFIDNDRHLLITTAFGPVEVLTLDIDELIRESKSRLSRTFTDTECSTYNIDPCPTLEELQTG
ncbi:MAG: protein kinase [Actinomycetia bacterium]|nr:protein kinase [Actinomycetes bacterium]